VRVQPIRHLAESLALLRAHPFTSCALGIALVISVCGLCCGLGFVTVPWFGCELYAFQVHAATGERPPRTRSWLSASVFVLGGTLIVMSAGWLSTIGLDVRMEDASIAPAADVADARHALVSAVGGLLALLFIMPFTYAPRILVDRGGTLGAAVLESVRFFVRHGFVRHVGLALLAHLVQTAPVSLAALLALTLADESAVPLALLAGLPFMIVTVPLGQGIVTAAWIARRDMLVDARAVTERGRAPRALAALLVLVLLAPPVTLAMLVGSVARPSRVHEGHAPHGEVVADLDLSAGPTDAPIPSTALSIEASADGVSIVASDGGGVGALPLNERGAVQRVRAVRVRDAYAVEITTANAGAPLLTWVDRAGVRLDDDLRARLGDRVPLWGRLALAAVLLFTPFLVMAAFVSLAELRALSTRVESEDTLASARRRALTLAGSVALLLAPLAALSVAAGVLALLA
jgi:hypothetical protein